MSLTLVSVPAGLVVSLNDAKAHLRVSHTDDDDYITAAIQAATGFVEQYTHLDFQLHTWDWSFNTFPAGNIVLPRYPVQSITSITYNDVTQSPSVQTVATTVYGLDAGAVNPCIYLKYNQVWPTHTEMHNSITVRFVSGYSQVGSPQTPGHGHGSQDGVPKAIDAAIKLIVGDLYEHREKNLDMQVYENDTVFLLLNAYRRYRV